MTDRVMVSRWLAGYEAAWRAPGTEDLAGLFTADATYLQSPYEQPVTGLHAITRMWEEEREGPGEVFTVATDFLAVEGPTAVVRAEVSYGDSSRQEYRDLWIIRLADDERCTWFEEWPYWPERPYAALGFAASVDAAYPRAGGEQPLRAGPDTCHTGPMPVNTRCAAVLAGTALLGIGLDQATKVLLVATLEGKPPIRVVGQVLTIYVSRNSGAAFGFAPAATVLFTCVAVAVAVLIVTKVPRLCSVGWAAALGLLLAGAVGNLCDRLMRTPGFGRGTVVDFIDLQHFADFNVADICLTCGVVLVVLLSLRGIPMTDQPGDYARSAPARRAHQ